MDRPSQHPKATFRAADARRGLDYANRAGRTRVRPARTANVIGGVTNPMVYLSKAAKLSRDWEPALKSMTVPLSLFLFSYVGGIFYIFPSGLPQPADLVIPLLGLMLVKKYSSAIPADLRGAALLFGVWVILVNTFWAWRIDDFSLLRPILFYSFNFIVLFTTIILVLDERTNFFFWLRSAVLLSTFIEVILIFRGSSGLRTLGTFNNPNQLGYWAVLNICCLGASLGRNPVRTLDVAAVAALLYISAASMSRAAMVAIALAAVLIIILQGASQRIWAAGIFCVFVVLPVSYFGGFLDDYLNRLSIVESLEMRMESLQGRESGFSVRGYGRILEFPEYLIAGSGEGAYYRFDTVNPIELHSTFGTVQFCYGIIGSILALGLLYQVFKYVGWKYVIYTAPVAVYGLSHNGLRFSWLWVFLGIVAARGIIINRRTRVPLAAANPSHRHADRSWQSRPYRSV